MSILFNKIDKFLLKKGGGYFFRKIQKFRIKIDDMFLTFVCVVRGFMHACALTYVCKTKIDSVLTNLCSRANINIVSIHTQLL